MAKGLDASVTSTLIATRVEFDANKNPLYIGSAVPGSLDNEAKWTIRRIDYSGELPVAIRYAYGNSGDVNVWDNRAALPYS